MAARMLMYQAVASGPGPIAVSGPRAAHLGVHEVLAVVLPPVVAMVWIIYITRIRMKIVDVG